MQDACQTLKQRSFGIILFECRQLSASKNNQHSKAETKVQFFIHFYSQITTVSGGNFRCSINAAQLLFLA
jgi:hypothetical protein